MPLLKSLLLVTIEVLPENWGLLLVPLKVLPEHLMGLLYFVYIQYLNKVLNRGSIFQGSLIFCRKSFWTLSSNIWKLNCLLCYKMYVCFNFKAHYIMQEKATSLVVSPAVGWWIYLFLLKSYKSQEITPKYFIEETELFKHHYVLEKFLLPRIPIA